MAELEYLDFDLWILRQADRYRVQARDFAGRAVPAVDCQMPQPGSGTIREDGARLFEAVFHASLRSCFFRSLDAARQRKAWLRLRLHLEDVPELAPLPWEGLYDADQRQFLALSIRTPVVRTLDLPVPIQPLVVQPPLEVMAVLASPSDYPELRAEEEWDHLRRALGELKRRGLVKLRRLRKATIPYLQQTLRRREVHVLHFIGHGGFSKTMNRGVLILEDKEGRGARVDSDQLGVVLDGLPSLRLVVLNCCSGAEASPRDVVSGLAQRLVKNSIPAVVAMRREIRDLTAATFSQELYKALADGYPVDAAVTEARKGIYLEGNPEWVEPALFLRSGDSHIFHLEPGDRSLTTTGQHRLPIVIGRKQQLRELRARLEAVRAGAFQFVLLEGGEGVGKSRLLEELAVLCRHGGLQVLRGYISGPESALPYQWICELIQRSLRPESPIPPPDLSDLAAELVASFPILSEVPELRAAAEQACPNGPRPAPPENPGVLYELLARALSRLGGGRPTAILVENLHAAGASIGALRYLAQRLGATPTLIAGTCRPDDVGPAHPLHELRQSLRSDERSTILHVEPFTIEELRQWIALLVDLPANDKLDRELVEELYAATAGNPFFAKELVRFLMETERIRSENHGTWILTSPMGPSPLPLTIRQAIASRVERLTPEQQDVLAVASVLGRRFDERDLEELADDHDLDAVLEELIHRGFLEEDAELGGHALRFASGVLCDVLYGHLGRRRCRRLHRRHAESLERRFHERSERVLPRLVDHFSKGAVAEKTVRYALQLARGSLLAFSPKAAIRAVGKALDLATGEDGVNAELYRIRARALHLAGRYKAALEEAEIAANAFEEAGDPAGAAAAALAAADAAWQSRNVGETRKWIEIGSDLARGANAVATRRRLLSLGVRLANLGGDSEKARIYLEEIEGLAPPPGEPPEEEVPKAGVLVTVLPQPVASLDPAASRTDEELEVTACVFETLLASDDTHGIVVPALAKGWESSPDGRRFTLELRDGITFSDRRSLNAGDVKASFERAARIAAQTPVFTNLAGFEELRRRETPALAGIEARDELTVVFHLMEPLPIFPALLTDPTVAVVCETQAGSGRALVGTGPFRVRERGASRVVLERNPHYWRGSPPRLESVVFRTDLDAAGIATALRHGELDLARDLLPEDLEGIAQEAGWQRAEAPKANVYFVLFNQAGPLARHTDRRRHADLRRALLGVVRPLDLVRRALGLFAQPAASLIPPGFLGHDPRRRQPTLAREEALELLRETGLDRPLRLKAAVHPILRSRYEALTRALVAGWSELGVEVEPVTTTMKSFLAHREEQSRDIDLMIGRWNADYNDPDTFTYRLFHSRRGLLRSYYSSPDADRWLAEARQTRSPERRLLAYQKFEDLLVRDRILLPMFHDLDYRLAGDRVRELRMRPTFPYVDYSTLGKLAAAPTPGPPGRDQAIRVPIAARLTGLDPAAEMLIDRLEVTSNVFETLTRIGENAEIELWLAASVEPAGGGRSYRIRLHPGIRFHDNHPLTARDVRASFERLLKRPQANAAFLLLPIEGARQLRDGAAQELAGFRILSDTEFVIALERPGPFFPAQLSSPALAIVPEGSGELDGHGPGGYAGTGPFRVVDFDPGKALELERNPRYWRPGYPKSRGLSFEFGASPEKVYNDFVGGRLHLASGLRPDRLKQLRRDPRFARGYRESPRLATYFLVLNTRQGPFSDPELRRAFARTLDGLEVETALRETGFFGAKRAHGLIPPGLLGYESREPPRRASPPLRDLRLRAVVHPEYAGPYAGFWDRLGRFCSQQAGVTIETTRGEIYDLLRRARDGGADLIALRFLAIYPDTDGFVGSLLQSEEGMLAGNFGWPEIDRLIAEARGETNRSRRHGIYARIEDTLCREALLVPLFHETIYRFCHPEVQGLCFGPTVPEVYYEELHFQGRRES